MSLATTRVEGVHASTRVAGADSAGRIIAITRGVNLDDTDWTGQNLKGVAFQQSVLRNCNFKGGARAALLLGARRGSVGALDR